jgi:hypothetical protein
MKMPQINVTITDVQYRLLVKLAAEAGRSISGMAAECIDIGVDTKIEAANKRAVFFSMEEKRQRQRALLEEEDDNK